MSPNYLQVLHNAFCPVVIIIHVSNSVSSGNPPARPSSSIPRRCPHVRNCCPDAYHETPTSCVSQGASLDLPLLSWNIYNASTAIYYAGPACLGGGREREPCGSSKCCNVHSPKMSPSSVTTTRSSTSLPLPLPLSLGKIYALELWRPRWQLYRSTSHRRVAATPSEDELPHASAGICQTAVFLSLSLSLLPASAPCCPCSCCSCCRHFLLALSGPKLLLLLFSFLLLVFSLFFAIF